MESIRESVCVDELIPAYIDGELDLCAHPDFELHLESCSDCRAELRAHQLFMCELDASLLNDVDVEMPANFSRVVAARAVSDMSGVRSATENRRALVICIVLAVTGTALVGNATREVIVTFVRRTVGGVVGVVGFVWHAFYDSITSVTIISRVVTRKFIIETGSIGIVLGVFALGVLVLTHLISRYHRMDATD